MYSFNMSVIYLQSLNTLKDLAEFVFTRLSIIYKQFFNMYNNEDVYWSKTTKLNMIYFSHKLFFHHYTFNVHHIMSVLYLQSMKRIH